MNGKHQGKTYHLSLRYYLTKEDAFVSRMKNLHELKINGCIYIKISS